MTDQNRPLPSTIQQDPNPNTSPSIFRPVSYSSDRAIPQPKGWARHLQDDHISSNSVDTTTFLDHRDQIKSLDRNMSISHSLSHAHGRRLSHFPRRPKQDGQYSSDETSDQE